MPSSEGFTRRRLLQLASVVVPLPATGLLSTLIGAVPPASAGTLPVSDHFPSYPPELARETVTVAHFDLQRVMELVEAHSSLALATWDWGFGDWESALGAASHTGNRPIAEYLISRGARPSLFSAAMLGQVDVVKALIAAHPGAQRIRGPHSISLLAHARMGGEAARPVLEFLQSFGDADVDPPVPLPAAEAAALVGSYTFGAGMNQQIEIDADIKMVAGKMFSYAPQLNWTRKGAMPRALFHLGDHIFYPGGGPSVRIRFSPEPGTMVMTVSDADLSVTARRKVDSR